MILKALIKFLWLLPFLTLSCAGKLDMDADIIEGEAVCWMESLPDDTPLTALSIPGAHDAATSSITAWSTWTRTQQKNVAQLWNCGVRAFDLRPALVNGELGIYHDKYSANVSFPQVMEALILALEKHPGECAIVIIRHEEEADGNTPLWKDAMGSYLSSIRSSLVDYSPTLTLGELRGKILVLSRNEYSGGPIGGYIRNWSHSAQLASQQRASIIDPEGKAHPLWVQDYYHPDGAQDKWAAVKGLLDATVAAGDNRPLVINHASAYVGTLPDYRTNARNINPRAADYISSLHAPVGIVLMDFADDPLLQALIDNN